MSFLQFFIKHKIFYVYEKYLKIKHTRIVRGVSPDEAWYAIRGGLAPPDTGMKAKRHVLRNLHS